MRLIASYYLSGNVLLQRNVSPTTIGAKEVNFCVRHGNRCDLLAIVTRQMECIIILLSGDNGKEVTPVPMPNTEVKLLSADGSWTDVPLEQDVARQIIVWMR